MVTLSVVEDINSLKSCSNTTASDENDNSEGWRKYRKGTIGVSLTHNHYLKSSNSTYYTENRYMVTSKSYKKNVLGAKYLYSTSHTIKDIYTQVEYPTSWNTSTLKWNKSSRSMAYSESMTSSSDRNTYQVYMKINETNMTYYPGGDFPNSAEYDFSYHRAKSSTRGLDGIWVVLDCSPL